MPCVPAAGVPESVAVPLPLFVNVTPPGSAPDSVTVALGYPVVDIEKLPVLLAAKVAALALVKAGAWSTVRVNISLVVAIGLVAVIVKL